MATYLPLLGPSQVASTGAPIPAAGTTGQALLKNTNADYDVVWGTVATGSVSLTTGVSGILPIASGGTGAASPALVAGTNVVVTGSWPNQTVGFSGVLPLANGGTATATPALVAGANVTITGTWPNQTIAAPAKATYSIAGANTLTQATHSNTHGSWTGGTTAVQTLPSTQTLGDYIEVTNDGTAVITFANVTAAPGFKNSALAGETFQAISNGTAWRSITPRTNSAINALTDGTTITWDTDIGGIASVTLGGNRTLVISNPQDGGVYALWITQDGTGTRTLTLPTNVKKAASDALSLSTAANAVDYMVLTYNATKAIFEAAVKLNIA